MPKPSAQPATRADLPPQMIVRPHPGLRTLGAGVAKRSLSHPCIDRDITRTLLLSP
jgi:hypothetical protein